MRGMAASSAPPRHLSVPSLGAARESEAKLRRYRLARQRLATLRRDAGGPFAHLKRSYD